MLMMRALSVACMVAVGNAVTLYLGVSTPDLCIGYHVGAAAYAAKIAWDKKWAPAMPANPSTFDVEIRMQNSFCKPGASFSGILNMLSPGGTTPPIHALVGEMISPICMETGRLTAAFGVPHLGSACIAGGLKDQGAYPTFTTMMPSNKASVKSALTLLSTLEKKRGEQLKIVSFYFTDESLGRSSLDMALALMPSMGLGNVTVQYVALVYSATVDPVLWQPAFDKARAVGSKVNFLAFQAGIVDVVMPAMHKAGLTGTDKIFMDVIGSAAGLADPTGWEGQLSFLQASRGPKFSEIYADLWTTLTPADFATASGGYFVGNHAVGPHTGKPKLDPSLFAAPLTKNRYAQEVVAHNGFDAALFMIHLFDKHMKSADAGADPEATFRDNKYVRKLMESTSNMGATGGVAFVDNDREAAISMLNRQASGVNEIGLVDTKTLAFTFASDWVFGDGTTTVPQLNPPVCPKGSAIESKTGKCSICPQGKFTAQIDSGSCSECPARSWTKAAGATACKLVGELCDKSGHSFDISQKKCTACPNGKFWSLVGCTHCQPGTMAAKPGSMKCTACAKGTFQNFSGKAVCNDCPVGRYSSEAAGNVLCSACQPGTFNNKIGQSECTRCGVGLLSESTGSTACASCEKHLRASSTLFQGASSPDDCICMKGNYNGEALLGKRGCVACGEGLLCDEAGLTKPNAKKGYYIHNLKPDQVYLCEPPEACVGGKWAESVCKAPRYGFMCTKCPDGLSINNDLEEDTAEGCVPCSAFTSAIVALVPLGAFILTLTVMYRTPASPLDENPSVLEAQNTIGQLVMFVQVVNAVFATQMLYGDPLNSFMDSLLTHLDPDKIFQNTPCLSDAIKEPVSQYALVITAPLMFMVLLGLVYISFFFIRPGTFKLDGLINVVGEVLVEFYISVTLAIFAPFQCYKHPNGTESVQKYPQVICGETDHQVFKGLSVFGIMAYPLPALAVSLFMTWQYPRSMAKSDISILAKFAFLFERWDPPCYWFCNVSLFRNFLIAVLPTVLPYDQLDVTILLMTMVLVIALMLLIWFKPRRSRQQNLLDVFISFVQVAVLSFGSSTVHGTVLRSSLSALCVVLLIAVIAAVCILAAVKVFQVVAGTSTHSVYLCHHAGAGGSACRVLHSVLCNAINGSVYYDIDNLGNLGMLLDAACISENMIVAIGSETLCREWCIGAITCARKKKATLQTIMFADPKPEETVCKQDVQGSVTTRGRQSLKHETASFEVDAYVLRGYGIPQDEVYLVIQDLTKVLPTIMNFCTESTVCYNLEQLFAGMASAKWSNSLASVASGLFSSKRCLEQCKGKDGNLDSAPSALHIIIVCDNFDGEAVAASRLFQSIFSKTVTCVEDQDLAPVDFANIVRAGQPANCVFMFTEYTHKSVAQLSRLGLIVKSHQEMHMLPVCVGENIKFPDEAFMAELERGNLLELGSNPGSRLAAAAGDTVELQDLAKGLLHVMSFLISFINIPKLKQSQMEAAVLNVLSRATGACASRSKGKWDSTTPAQISAPTEDQAYSSIDV